MAEGLDPRKVQEYNKNVQESKKSTREVREETDSLKNSIRDVLFATRDYADEAKKAAKVVFESTIAASETAKAFRDIASAAKGITDNYAEVLSGEESFQTLLKDREKLYKSQLSFNTEYEQFLRTVIRDQDTINQILEGTLDPFDALENSTDALTEDNFKLLELYQLQNKEIQQEAANMAEVERRGGNIEQSMKVFGKDAIGLADAAEGISEGFSKAGLGNLSSKLGIGDAIKDTRKFAASMTDGGDSIATGADKMKILNNFAGNIGTNLMKSLGPAALLAMAIEQIVKAFQLIDGQSGEVAKTMGVSAEEGRALVASSADAAAMSGDLLVSTKDVVAAQMQLNKAFGTSVQFSGEFAAEFASIQERTGLSAHSMEVFAEKALIAGTSIEDQLKKVTAVTMELSAQSGVMLNAKDIQEGIGEMSAAQVLTAKMNTKEMANQVFQSKLLGISQSQLEGVGQSLLDFESSIAAEMEAELLTGKDLNLERARGAALAGDQATLAQELRKEVGTAAEFGEMNVIQQEALAKAFGMQREDLAKMLLEQEKLEAVKAAGFKSVSEAQDMYNKALAEGTLTEEKKEKLQKAGLLNQMESATQQEKLNAAMEKITDLFVQIIDPLMPLVDAITSILEPIFAILSPIISLIGDLTKLILSTLNPALDAVMGFMNRITENFTTMFGGVKDIIKGIVTLDFGLILDGLKSVAKAAIGMISSPFQMLLDLVFNSINAIIKQINRIPGVNIETFETPDIAGNVSNFVGLAEGGIVTEPTTALIGEGGEPEAVVPLSKANSVGFGEGNSEVVTLLRELITAVNSGGNIYLDSTKVGTAMAVGTYKVQ